MKAGDDRSMEFQQVSAPSMLRRTEIDKSNSLRWAVRTHVLQLLSNDNKKQFNVQKTT